MSAWEGSKHQEQVEAERRRAAQDREAPTWVHAPGQSPDAPPMAQVLGPLKTPQDIPHTEMRVDALDSQSMGDITEALSAIVVALKPLPNPSTQARVLAAAGSLLGISDIYAVLDRSR